MGNGYLQLSVDTPPMKINTDIQQATAPEAPLRFRRAFGFGYVVTVSQGWARCPCQGIGAISSSGLPTLARELLPT